MSSGNLGIVIKQYEAESNDLESQIIKLSESKLLKHKHSSAKLTDIRHKYSEEKSSIRNQIRSLDSKESNDEYKKLMADLNDIKDQESAEIAAEEDLSEENETQIQLQIDEIQTKKEAIDADLEGFKQCREEDIKDEFSYFVNGK